jgi:uncharacterized heparinase superfamily protein
MNQTLTIPQGEERITIELTVKEAMALTGYKFNQNPKQLAFARRKVKHALDRQVLGDAPLTYEELTH